MFVDKTRIYVQSGKGGDGCKSFRREKYIPKGGPDGGDGGKGGDIYIESNPHLNTLLDLTYRPHYKSQSGFPGRGKNKHGKSVDDLVINVPPGVVVYKVEDNNHREFLADLKDPFHKILISKGGRGGRGNLSFKSQKNKAPKFAEKGEPGEKVTVDLELKLIADVGIIGCPNAGKSTLLSCITSAKPKIAPYPFTTISPNLGVVTWKEKNFVIIDVPGLIKDAHLGKGLGGEFLRHIERTRILIHLVDIFDYNNNTAYRNYISINEELKQYSSKLARKKMIIVANKMDLTDSKSKLAEFGRSLGKKKVYPISAATGSGIKKLLDTTIRMLNKPAIIDTVIYPTEKRYIFEPEFTITKRNNVFVIKGKKVENFVAMTNFQQEEAVRRLQNILKKIGLEKMLKKQNIKQGDVVKIGDYEFDYYGSD